MEICSDLSRLQKYIANKDSIALYFSDGICGVAESLYPKLDDLFTAFPYIQLYSVIGPMNPEIQGHFQVFTSPCLLVWIDGKETIRKVGNFSVDQLKKEIERIYELRFL